MIAVIRSDDIKSKIITHSKEHLLCFRDSQKLNKQTFMDLMMAKQLSLTECNSDTYHLFHHNPQIHQTILLIISPSEFSQDAVDKYTNILRREIKDKNFESMRIICRYIFDSLSQNNDINKRDITKLEEIISAINQSDVKYVHLWCPHVLQQIIKLQSKPDFVISSLRAAQSGMRLIGLINRNAMWTIPQTMVNKYGANIPTTIDFGFIEYGRSDWRQSLAKRPFFKHLQTNDERTKRLMTAVTHRNDPFLSNTKLIYQEFDIKDDDEIQREENEDNNNNNQPQRHIKSKARIVSLHSGNADIIQSMVNDFIDYHFHKTKENKLDGYQKYVKNTNKDNKIGL